VIVQIGDNDSAGVSVMESDGSTAVDEEGPSSDTYTVVLDSRPTANVTITVLPDDQTDAGAGPGAAIVLTFNGGNWNQPQTVTVTAVDDAVVEGLHTSTLTHAVASADPAYDDFDAPAVTVIVGDNDHASDDGGADEPDDTPAPDDGEDPREPSVPLVADAGPDIHLFLGQTAVLDGSASYSLIGAEIIDYMWDFGIFGLTGQYARGPVTEWLFDTPGAHMVVLTVQDDQGNYAQDVIFVNVVQPPPDPPFGCGLLCFGPLGATGGLLTLGLLFTMRFAGTRAYRRWCYAQRDGAALDFGRYE
jgi:hypothetical protein